MKLAPQQMIAAGLLAALGLTAFAQTPPQPPAAPGAPAAPHMAPREGMERMSPGQRHERMQERMHKRMEGRLAKLKQKLQITPAQESAWTAFSSAMKPASMQRPDRAEFAKLTTPERIDRMRAMRTARQAEMDKRGDATKTFYAALTPEQKKVFDQATMREHGRGGHGRHGGHHKA
jgi:periplasmic protein CpxP/Spy